MDFCFWQEFIDNIYHTLCMIGLVFTNVDAGLAISQSHVNQKLILMQIIKARFIRDLMFKSQ
jgi:hypothetical protein